MTTTQDTADWRRIIEVALDKTDEADEAADAARAAFDELVDLGELIESAVDNLLAKLVAVEKERDEFEKERDALQDRLNTL